MGACVIGMPSKDTVKVSDENGFVQETPERNLVGLSRPLRFLNTL